MLGGVRWAPFGRRRVHGRVVDVGRTGFYVQAELGYAELNRHAMDEEWSTVARGIAAGARLGLPVMQARDWSLGFEVHDHVALLGGDEGLRHSDGLHAFLQLFIPTAR